MPDIHQSFADLATKLIDKNGRKIELITIVNSGSSFDPDQSNSVVEIKAVDVKYKADEVDGNLIQVTDKLFLVDSNVEPKNEMRLRDGDISYSIKSVSRVKPGELTCLYKVQARL